MLEFVRLTIWEEGRVIEFGQRLAEFRARDIIGMRTVSVAYATDVTELLLRGHGWGTYVTESLESVRAFLNNLARYNRTAEGGDA